MPNKLPDISTQWYNKNDHRLFRSEIAAMKKFFPKAGFGFFKSDGQCIGYLIYLLIIWAHGELW